MKIKLILLITLSTLALAELTTYEKNLLGATVDIRVHELYKYAGMNEMSNRYNGNGSNGSYEREKAEALLHILDKLDIQLDH